MNQLQVADSRAIAPTPKSPAPTPNAPALTDVSYSSSAAESDTTSSYSSSFVETDAASSHSISGESYPGSNASSRDLGSNASPGESRADSSIPVSTSSDPALSHRGYSSKADAKYTDAYSSSTRSVSSISGFSIKTGRNGIYARRNVDTHVLRGIYARRNVDTHVLRYIIQLQSDAVDITGKSHGDSITPHASSRRYDTPAFTGHAPSARGNATSSHSSIRTTDATAGLGIRDRTPANDAAIALDARDRALLGCSCCLIHLLLLLHPPSCLDITTAPSGRASSTDTPTCSRPTEQRTSTSLAFTSAT